MSKSSPVNSASAIANDLFDQFIAASNLKGVVTTFRKICHELDLTPGPFNVFYPALKHGLSGGKHKQLKNWKAASIFNKIDKKASNRIYTAPSNINSYTTNDTSYAGSFGSGSNNNHNNNSSNNSHQRNSTTNATTMQFGGTSTTNAATVTATTVGDNGNCNNVHHTSNNILSEHNCLIIGGGPCGLRTAIELQLLGAGNVVVVEKRDRFSRNNVLHLWPFVIADLKQMAGKKFYGKFCAGSIDHVSIRQLQLMLLKFALILGVNFVENITFEEMCPRSLTVSLSKRQQQQQRICNTCNGQCNKSQCNCNVTSMSQQLNLKPNCDECCLNCTSDDVTDGNVLTNCCTGGNKRRHTGNTSTNTLTSSTTTGVGGSGTGNDVNELLKNSTTKLLTPPSSSSSMDDEDFGDEEDEEQKVPDMDECITSRTRNRSTTKNHSQRGKSVNGHEFTNGTPDEDDDANGDDENCKKLHLNSSSNFKNVKCSCCCHLHSSKNLNINCPHESRGKWLTTTTPPTTTSNSSGYSSDSFVNLTTGKTGAFAHFSITSPNPTTASDFVNYYEILQKLHTINFDVVLGADGRRATLSDYFPRKEFRGRLAIAITANFVNTHTLDEARIPEISGISFIYNQQLFKSLYDDKGIDLENICYYKDDTHYFVMTAKKSSLLERKVLYTDHADTRALLAPENINRSQLLEYAKDAAKWTTGLQQPLAINHYGEPDVAMFDFTSMYAAENACRAKKINRHIECNCKCKTSTSTNTSSMANGTTTSITEQTSIGDGKNESLLLVGLVGDSLLEPFWPTGSGCARGFLSAMDSAWMVRQWALKRCASNFNEEDILSVLQEREAIYRLLGQTKSENLNQNYASYTLNPLTRYPNLNSSKLLAHQCRHLLFDDIAAPATNDLRSSVKQTLAAKRLRRATIASSLPFTSGILDGDTFNNRNLMSESIGEESTLTCTNSNDTLMKEEDEDADEVPNERLVKKSTSAALKREFLNNSHSSNSSINSQVAKVATLESSKKRSLGYDVEANDAFEKSLADFEKSYMKGIKTTEHTYSNGSNSNLTQISSLSTTGGKGAKSLNKSSTFSDVILSPSANNLASIGKSRAKEIEAALRHRRQQASVFNRSSEQNCNSPIRSSKKYSSDEHSNRSDSKVSLDKSKFAWLLDQETSAQLSDNPKSDTAATNPQIKSNREPFVSRVKNIEAKLTTASSGIHYFDPSYENEDTIDRKKIASKGSNVMAAASTLQQLLNPSFQENKLKERAADYRKKNSDIKVVMKMTNETDWNKKKWSERESQAKEEKKAKPPTSLAPRPKELLDLFIGKKHEIEEKLTEKKAEEIKVMNTTSTRRQRSRRADDNEWIAILKGELNDRKVSSKDTPRQAIKAPYKSPFAEQEVDAVQEKGRAKFQFMSKGDNHRDRESKMARPKEITDAPPATGSSSTGMKNSLCVRCKNQVALVDRILISGFLIHRSCLTCSKCHVTLRLSEVRSNNFVDDVDLTSFNYLCILCSKNKVNSRSNLATSASTSSVITGKPPLDCISIPDSNGKSKNRPRSPVSSLHERLEKERIHQQSMASFAATDEYELRLKERMKWKEQFLMNNNNDFDLGLLIQRQILKGKDSKEGESTIGQEKDNLSLGSAEFKREPSADRTDSSTETADATSDASGKTGGESNVNRKINERIGYENTSRTRELFDDDELTKLLNLESDQWESGEEEEEASTSSSESDQRSEDSTEADFDSDEAFDASTASKLKSFPLPEDENQAVPEIVIETTDPGDEEVGTATGDEIDTTGVLDIGSNESKGQTTITNLTNEADHSSSDSDTLAGEATDSILVEDEERVKLLNSSTTTTTSNSKSSSSDRVNCSTEETESEIWSESNKSSNKDNKNKIKPKKLATLAEMESIGGSIEALPLMDQECSNLLSPNKDTITTSSTTATSTTVATIGSPAITKSYTVSPSSFENTKSSCNTLNSPSLLRSISVSPETSNTPTSQSNVRSSLNLNSNCNWNASQRNLTDSSGNQSETLLPSFGNNYTYTGLSNATTSPLLTATSATKFMDNQDGPCSIVTTINNSNSITSGNCDTSKQVGSSLFLTSSNLSPMRSNSIDAQNTTTATSFASVSQFNTNFNQSSKFTNPTISPPANANYTINSPLASANVVNPNAPNTPNAVTGASASGPGRVKTFTSQFNCLDSVKCSSSSSPGFRVAQPKITVFNLDAYKLPSSNLSGSNSGLNKSLDQPNYSSPSPPVCSFNRTPLQTNLDSSVDSFTEGSSQAVINSSCTSSAESYSRIPVLSKRTIPAYRGSFTDKLLERCRSTPSLDASPEARKLSIANSPASGAHSLAPAGSSSNPSPPPENSVLAKWACSNLLQMSTHEVGATPQLPFLKNDKLQLSNSNISPSGNLNRNYNLMSNSQTFGKSTLARSNSTTHPEVGGRDCFKYDNSRSNYPSLHQQPNGQSSSLHIELNNPQLSSKLTQQSPLAPSVTSSPLNHSNDDRYSPATNFRSNYYSSPPPTTSSPSMTASLHFKNHLHPSPLANESPSNSANASPATTNGYLGKHF